MHSWAAAFSGKNPPPGLSPGFWNGFQGAIHMADPGKSGLVSNIYQWGVMGASAKNVAELTGLLWAD
ncbi:hypothetical protein [Streptosporangium sp. NPDC020145]